MADAAESAIETSEVSDEQVGEFFESKGEKAPPEQKEESKQDEKVEQKTDEKQEKRETVVPYAALHEERMRRKEEKQRADRLEARFQQIMERMAPPQQEQVKLPDPQQDPAGFAIARTQQLEQVIQKQGESLEQFQQRQEESTKQAQFDNNYRSSCAQFASSKPDFADAYNFVINGRTQMLIERAGMDPAEAQQRVVQEERAIANTAFMLGMNPGQLLYQIAASNGYAPKQQQQEQRQANEQKLETVSKGTQAKSLSSVRGKSPSNLTLEALADMDDAEFIKNFDAVIRKT